MKSKLSLPKHPFFDTQNKQASFIDCIDAINRIRDMVEVCDYLHVGMTAEEAISPNVVSGHYWLASTMQNTLRYISHRLSDLHRQECESHQQQSARLTALVKALPSLNYDNRERLLNSAAANMDIRRSDLNRFIRKQSKK